MYRDMGKRAPEDKKKYLKGMCHLTFGIAVSFFQIIKEGFSNDEFRNQEGRIRSPAARSVSNHRLFFFFYPDEVILKGNQNRNESVANCVILGQR